MTKLSLCVCPQFITYSRCPTPPANHAAKAPSGGASAGAEPPRASRLPYACSSSFLPHANNPQGTRPTAISSTPIPSQLTHIHPLNQPCSPSPHPLIAATHPKQPLQHGCMYSPSAWAAPPCPACVIDVRARPAPARPHSSTVYADLKESWPRKWLRPMPPRASLQVASLAM